MRIPRIHVPSLPDRGEAEIPLPAAHHLRSVLRLAPGAPVVLFDGHGRACQAVLTSLARQKATAALQTPLEAESGEPALRLVLGIAPLKGDALSWVVEKATELGVSEIWLIEAQRADQSARTALSPHRLERLQRIAVSAAEQCERSRVPEINSPATLATALERTVQGPRLICAERSSQPWPSPPTAVDETLLLVGPHGGWTSEEVDLAVASGCQPISLGPRILRAETAALAALAVAQATWGDGPGRTGANPAPVTPR
jgi:16S rRNA (uracil1498-N3)-methyltransferase